LNVYNAFTPLKNTVSGRTAANQLAKESEESLQREFHRISLDSPDLGHSFQTISRQGELVAIVSELVEALEIDLVVIGNKGRSELEAIFFGSNALHIIGEIKKCPILTIPKELDFKPPKSIAFVTDYSRPYDAGLLHPLVTMANRYGAKIRVMHINETEELSRAQDINLGILMEYLKPYNCTAHWMPLYKSKATAIHDFLRELDIDILAMVNYQHSLIQELTHEPVIKRMAFNPDIPFLVIPDGD
jgi:nucleotide-binding universal stress UspA family protein